MQHVTRHWVYGSYRVERRQRFSRLSMISHDCSNIGLRYKPEDEGLRFHQAIMSVLDKKIKKSYRPRLTKRKLLILKFKDRLFLEIKNYIYDETDPWYHISDLTWLVWNRKTHKNFFKRTNKAILVQNTGITNTVSFFQKFTSNFVPKFDLFNYSQEGKQFEKKKIMLSSDYLL